MLCSNDHALHRPDENQLPCGPEESILVMEELTNPDRMERLDTAENNRAGSHQTASVHTVSGKLAGKAAAERTRPVDIAHTQNLRVLMQTTTAARSSSAFLRPWL